MQTKSDLMGLNTNLANANKWYAFLPLKNVLGEKYQNLNLHIREFSLPQLVMGSTTVAYKGYQKEVPTKILNAEDKMLTLTYLIDETWSNYRALFAWISSPVGTLNPIVKNVDTNKSISPSQYIPLRIYMLDNYKKKIIQFVFENCWIKMFSDLMLNTNSDIIEHSFTFCYDNYFIEDISNDEIGQ